VVQKQVILLLVPLLLRLAVVNRMMVVRQLVGYTTLCQILEAEQHRQAAVAAVMPTPGARTSAAVAAVQVVIPVEAVMLIMQV
jgi:hypothetical protein